MWERFLFIVLLSSSLSFAQNQTDNQTINVTTTTTFPYKWMGEIYGIVANQTIWCKELHDIDMVGARFNCMYYEDKSSCMCSAQLPANVTPGFFIGLQQIEERYKSVIYSKEREISNLTGWIVLMLAYFVLSVLIVLYMIFVYPKTLTEV